MKYYLILGPSHENTTTLQLHANDVFQIYGNGKDNINCKKQLAEDIILFTNPMREKIKSIINDKTYQEKVWKMGAEKARESASKTLNGVREIIGMNKM